MRYSLTLGLLGAAAIVGSHPHKTPNSHAYKQGIKKRTVDLEGYRLKLSASYHSSNELATDPVVATISKRDTYVQTATDLVKTIVPGKEFRVVDDHYVGTNGIAHVNFKQQVHGIDIDNADFNVNIGPDGKVFSYGNNFFTGDIPASSPLRKREFAGPVEALNGAATILDLPVSADAGTVAEPVADKAEVYKLKKTTGAVSDPEARLVYFVTPDGDLSLTWRVETDVLDNWLLTYVDAATNEKVYGVVDYVAHATYQVYPWAVNDPDEGSRTILSNPWDSTASEFTWQSDGTTNYTVTRGNNGIAQVNPNGGSSYLNNYRPNAGSSLNFQYPYSLTATDPATYRDASVTQLFYTANTYHDLLYELGFTEAAGNFETNNHGQGGVGNDFVILNSQDGSGTNNANFATPPDGQNPRMRMYIWTYSTPKRDCCFEAGVVIHEFTHGLSNRLTGGPANTNCLNTLESGGMGEGWGDFMATAIRLKAGDTAATDYPLGAWVYNNPAGIRDYVYSTSLTTNPYTYASVNALGEVHDIGTVWATILYEVLWGLIGEHGKSTAARPVFDADGVPTDGKFLAMKLVVDGMALQPCYPTFVSARDAIIDADENLTGGANACTLWTAFAKRGLGTGAVYNSRMRTESFALPSGC